MLLCETKEKPNELCISNCNWFGRSDGRDFVYVVVMVVVMLLFDGDVLMVMVYLACDLSFFGWLVGLIMCVCVCTCSCVRVCLCVVCSSSCLIVFRCCKTEK